MELADGSPENLERRGAVFLLSRRRLSFLTRTRQCDPLCLEASPKAAVIDSQSVRVRGYDAAKKITSRKRHILTDTDGRLLAARVHSVDVQGRDGPGSL